MGLVQPPEFYAELTYFTLCSLEEQPVDGIHLWIEALSYGEYQCRGVLTGPEGSPYAGGLFAFQIDMNWHDRLYARFITKVFHPNITEDGLYYSANQSENLIEQLSEMRATFSNPYFHGSLNPEAAKLYCLSNAQFEEKAREFTKKYAY